MKKSAIVFGSNSELRAYQAIERYLPAGWHLYGNTPLSQVVEVCQSELTQKKWNFYLKSSVDFVLANPSQEPILAIEFDGLGGGYNSGQEYVLVHANEKDPYRKLKMDFKLKLCYSVGLPLIVISFDEIRAVQGDELISIAASMVGARIANAEYKATIAEWDRQHLGKGKSFEEMLWDDSVLRTELNFKYDPALTRLEEIYEEYEKLDVASTMESIGDPDQMTVLRNRSEFKSVGCRRLVSGTNLASPVAITVWVRNFAGDELGASLFSEADTSCGINPLKIAENICWYLSVKRTIEVAKNKANA